MISWIVYISGRPDTGTVASQPDALQAIANAIGCDWRELDAGKMSPLGRYDVSHRGRYVGSAWDTNPPSTITGDDADIRTLVGVSPDALRKLHIAFDLLHAGSRGTPGLGMRLVRESEWHAFVDALTAMLS